MQNTVRGAGYSGTPLPAKLGIKDGSRLAFVNEPNGWEDTLGPLPRDVLVKPQARRPLDVVVLFVTRRRELQRRFPTLAKALDPAGGLWVAWPKKTSGVDTDLTFLAVQEVGLEAGLVDNKVCAIDETWSGVRFVVRRADRPRRRE
jgi:hypothetical protein